MSYNCKHQSAIVNFHQLYPLLKAHTSLSHSCNLSPMNKVPCSEPTPPKVDVLTRLLVTHYISF